MFLFICICVLVLVFCWCWLWLWFFLLLSYRRAVVTRQQFPVGLKKFFKSRINAGSHWTQQGASKWFATTQSSVWELAALFFPMLHNLYISMVFFTVEADVRTRNCCVDRILISWALALHVITHFLKTLQLCLYESCPSALSLPANEQTWAYGANTGYVERHTVPSLKDTYQKYKAVEVAGNLLCFTACLWSLVQAGDSLATAN